MTLETKEMTRLSRCCCILDFKRGFSSINKPVVPWRATRKPFDALPFPLAFLHRWIWPPGSAQSCTRSGSHAAHHMTQLHSATPSTPVSQNWNILNSIEFYGIYWNPFKMIQRYWMDLQWTPHGMLQIGVCWLSTPSAPQPWRLPSQASGISRSPWPSPWGCPSSKAPVWSFFDICIYLHDICITSAQSWPYWQYHAISIHIPQIWANSTGHVSRCCKMLQDAARLYKLLHGEGNVCLWRQDQILSQLPSVLGPKQYQTSMASPSQFRWGQHPSLSLKLKTIQTYSNKKQTYLLFSYVQLISAAKSKFQAKLRGLVCLAGLLRWRLSQIHQASQKPDKCSRASGWHQPASTVSDPQANLEGKMLRSTVPRCGWFKGRLRLFRLQVNMVNNANINHYQSTEGIHCASAVDMDWSCGLGPHIAWTRQKLTQAVTDKHRDRAKRVQNDENYAKICKVNVTWNIHV